MTTGERTRVYPAPALVLGVGRFGLATLERLGEEWMGLNLSGGDDSLRNLRLLWIHAGDDEVSSWRQHEQQTISIAEHIGNDDLPSLALDFVILRALGLIRFHQGTYQVATPCDAGLAGGNEQEAADGSQGHTVRRLRFFQWHDLSPDPVVSAEVLKRLAEGNGDLDLFIAPIINRVRQGHSPRALLACIARCRALAAGRDPSPWEWLHRQLEHGSVDASGALQFAEPTVCSWLRQDDLGLEGVAQPPLESWWISRGDDVEPHAGWLEQQRQSWRSRPRAAGGAGGAGAARAPAAPAKGKEAKRVTSPADSRDVGHPDEAESWEGFVSWLSDAKLCKDSGFRRGELVLRIPDPLKPADGDPTSPLRPTDLLRVDWETTGWATEELEAEDSVFFEPLAASPFRLGLFDHDNSNRSQRGGDENLRRRLQKLAGHLHRGLVRLWVDLQRQRVEERKAIPGVRQRLEMDRALYQSLEILGGLTVRPLVTESGQEEEGQRHDGHGLGGETAGLPARPSEPLASMVMTPSRAEVAAEYALERRLETLGLTEDADSGPRRRYLLHQVELDARELDAMETPARSGCPAEEAEILPRLRRELNLVVRDLLSFSFLAAYRDRPTRQPPRLSVFVVGDMGEPFVRVSMRCILRAIHAELLRAFSPVFELHREGFDRALSIVPILWMPHPADALGGGDLARTRCEEAAIIEAVHGVRRWVESVLPSAHRRVSQIFVNGRVTDTSVISLAQAARQTRDFISLLVRTDISRDDWLRRVAVGPGGNDFFSSFSCYEIEFPAQRAREYLANRLARECLRSLCEETREGPGEGEGESDGQGDGQGESEVQDPDLAKLAAEPIHGLDALIGKLGTLTEEAADDVREMVLERLEVDRTTASLDILDRFDERFEAAVWHRIVRHWREMTGSRGPMDDLADELRRKTSRKLAVTLEELRKTSDRLIQDAAEAAGLSFALATLNRQRSRLRDRLQQTESRRRDGERLCHRHQIPERRPLEAARRGVIEAADRKPDQRPIFLGLGLWLLMAPALGAPLLYSAARLFQLPSRDGAAERFFEALLGPWAPLVGTVLLGLAAWGALEASMRRAVKRVRQAIEEMAAAARRIVQGGEGELEHQPTSIFSFFATRLRLTRALASRSYAMRVYKQAITDDRLAHRLSLSLDVQSRELTRRAEKLGVRPAMTPEGARDDLRSLFAAGRGERIEKLVAPEELHRFYRRQVHDPEELPLAEFLDWSGGFHEWRRTACLADTERIMDFGRRRFDEIVSHPITDQEFFADEVGERLCDFVERYYSNMGFGAKFMGYEGLDPDGVRLVADAALVLGKPLRRVYEKAREERSSTPRDPLLPERRRLPAVGDRGAPGPTPRGRPALPDRRRRGAAYIRTLDIHTPDVRRNAAYMLSLVQGIRAHSVHNLKRSESFHDRRQMPDDRSFALSGRDESVTPINHLTGYEDWATELYSKIVAPRSDDSRSDDSRSDDSRSDDSRSDVAEEPEKTAVSTEEAGGGG